MFVFHSFIYLIFCVQRYNFLLIFPRLAVFYFFLVAATIVGIFLLIVPIIGILVDVWFNHTVTVNLEGMAQYIIAVAGIFGAAGLTNAWTDYSYKKYNTNIFQNNGDQNVPQNTCGIDLNNDNNIDFRELHDDCGDA